MSSKLKVKYITPRMDIITAVKGLVMSISTLKTLIPMHKSSSSLSNLGPYSQYHVLFDLFCPRLPWMFLSPYKFITLHATL